MKTIHVRGRASLLSDVPVTPARLSRSGRGGRRRSGQSLLESCLAIGLICLIFMGLIQVSQLVAAYDVLNHAAARGSRAKTVGFNSWMVTKCVNVAAIPVSGRMRTPDYENIDQQLRDMVNSLPPGELWDAVLRETEPSSGQSVLELARIPDYLYSENDARGSYILDYDGWETLDRSVRSAGDMIEVTAGMDYDLRPLWSNSVHRSFYNADSVPLRGESTIENHYPLYLTDYAL